MKKFLLLKIVGLILVLVGFSAATFAQVTSSAMKGIVSDAKGPMPGATVVAVHNPTGTKYSVVTSVDGRYNFVNINTGGPYTVSVSFIGYKTEKIEGISLKLGETYSLPILLKSGGQELQEVVVVGKKDAVLNSKRTGPSTTISKEQLQTMPSLSRSLQDFTRATPQANGNSFGGANGRFNNITIDGAVNNDVFAASSTAITPGSGSGTQPISLDAIQEIQVVLAPYDVTQGNFTGGGVNAVTKSGTNKFTGTAYFFGRNENTIGKSVDGTNKKADPFYNTQYGVSVGGPIIKNKLFFFVNGELGRVQTPTTYNIGDPGAFFAQADADKLADYVKTKYGYDVGGTGSQETRTQNNKIFARLDWNIDSKNQLTLRHNYIKAYDDAFSRSGTLFRFGNNGAKINNNQNISVLEWRSAFSKNVSNNLIVGYSRIRDNRQVYGSLFPQVIINNINGVGGQSVQFGSERSSTANELDQDVFEFTDNLKIFAGKHTFTIGTHNEFFKFRNLFLNNAAGYYQFDNLANFYGDVAKQVEAAYSIVPGDPRPSAKFSAAQLGFYFQDEIDLSDRFKMTAGLRVDVPLFFDTPPANSKIAASFPNMKTDYTPSGQILVSPRMGFNYDVNGDRSIQLRGGIGLFTGRVPFVWLSNQFTNSGLLYGAVKVTASSDPKNPVVLKPFNPDPNDQASAGPATKTTEVNLIANNFKIPQVLRYSFGADFKLPGGVVFSADAMYSSTINNIYYKDINIKPATGVINPALSGGADTRPAFTGGKVNGTDFTNVFLLDNTNKGSAYSLTGQLQKAFDFGLYSSIAYTYGQSKDINSGTSSTAASNWQFNQIVRNPNDPDLSYSTFDIRHRIVGTLGYSVQYGKNKTYGTSFSLFYVGKSGAPYTYLYNGDVNGDGANQNDLIFIPRTAADIKLVDIKSGAVVTSSAAQQWTALDAFIENDPYLSKHRGEYAQRNGARTPWEHQFDVRLMQDIGGMIKGSKNRLQISFDIINVGNLLNKDWGRSYFVSNNASTLISYTGSGYTFRPPASGTVTNVSAFASRWQGQVGVRYIFN